MASIRAFIAIDMPAIIVDFAGKRQQALKNAGIDMKWVRPENIHLTLQCLGDVETEKIHAVQACMEKAAREVSAFSLKAKGLGVFPSLKRPKVMWMGVTGQTDFLKTLSLQISDALVNLGIPQEKRVFKGHLTIGRIKGKLDTQQLGRVISAQKEYETPIVEVDSVCLFQSRLTPRGAIYTKLAEVSLGVSR